jgi:enamine deaminase RidA (YjgF/YER057c/UK114 family)
MKHLSPADIRAPFGHYHHGVLVPADARWLFTSGQLGVGKDDAIPESVTEQARQCFRNLVAILRDARMSFADVVRISAYVTDRAYFPAYMAVRDEFVATPPPASTLLVVGGFTRPEMKVEVELVAASTVP